MARPLGPGECGTLRGYTWHLRQNEETCPLCRAARAAAVRARYGKVTATRPGIELAPCGSPAAYNRHLAHGETPCAACRAAHSRATFKSVKVRRIVEAVALGDAAIPRMTKADRFSVLPQIEQYANDGMNDPAIGRLLGLRTNQVTRIRHRHGVASGYRRKTAAATSRPAGTRP